MLNAKYGIPREKLCVPSRGATTPPQPRDAGLVTRRTSSSCPESSERTAWSGYSRRRSSMTARSAARSVSVRKFPRPLTSTSWRLPTAPLIHRPPRLGQRLVVGHNAALLVEIVERRRQVHGVVRELVRLQAQGDALHQLRELEHLPDERQLRFVAEEGGVAVVA